MIRTDFDVNNEEYFKIINAHDELLHEYVKNHFLYEFYAYYLATGYRMDAIWEGNLDAILYGATDGLIFSRFIKELNHSKLKELLKEKYSIIITNEEPLKILDTKKEDQQQC